jgi:hypothetical protein
MICDTPLQLLSELALQYLGVTAALPDQQRLLTSLLQPLKLPSGDKQATRIGGGLWIDWPETLPYLVPWSGQVTLARLVSKYQIAVYEAISGKVVKPGRGEARRLPPSAVDLQCTGPIVDLQCSIKGASGMDTWAAQDPIDVGFSTNALGMEIMQSPVRELLAIMAVQVLPIVRTSRREYGVTIEMPDGGTHLACWTCEPRAGGYTRRWSALDAPVELPEQEYPTRETP